MTIVPVMLSTSDGHRSPPLGRSPFGNTAAPILAAGAYAIAALVWAATGGNLPGGRWLALHMFTLGVVTNLVLAFSDHFSGTVTRSPAEHVRWQLPVVNTGIMLVLTGITAAIDWAIAAGATVVTAVVLGSYRRLRGMRRNAVGARFVWIVRIYERAHGAFVHGAVLGALMGLGALSGTWYAAARIAHIHVNVLGWAGLTLLATLVFFGPTMARTRIVAGADERAAGALRYGATGLTIGVLLLLATGVAGVAAVIVRIAASAAIAVFAWAVTVTCVPVVTAVRRAKPSATRWPVVAVSLWFPLAAWADVAVIATGAWRYLEAVGVAILLGVLAQAMAAVLAYVAPMIRGRTFSSRAVLIARLERGAAVRTLVYNAGALWIVLAVISNTKTTLPANGGWAAVIAALAWILIVALAPRSSSTDESTPAMS